MDRTEWIITIILVLLFAILIISGIRISVQNPICYSDQAVQATVVAETLQCERLLQIPTATPYFPPTPAPCPTVLYKQLPDAKNELVNLELAMTSVVQARKALEEIMTMEGDYNNPPHSLAAVAINHLNNAYEWTDQSYNAVYGWWLAGMLTCP